MQIGQEAALVGHPALATKGRPLSVHTSGKSAGFMNELVHEVWAIHWCALVDPATQTLPGEQLIDDQESAAGQSRMASKRGPGDPQIARGER